MRVSFLTPRLPPVVCGLADHTKWLAQAMVKQGIEVGFIPCEAQCEDGKAFPGPVHRWDMCSCSLESCVAVQAPDWLWLQLSGYGYSRWGAPYRLGRELRRLRRRMPKLRLAIYVHETHCQPDQLGLKGRVLSPWQRHTVRRVARLGHVLFSSNSSYVTQIITQYNIPGEKVHQLPIGSNVPNATLSPEKRLQLRRELGWRDDEMIAVIFGRFPSQLRALESFKDLLIQGIRSGHLDRVVCLGGDQSEIPTQLAACVGWFPVPRSFQLLGHQPAHAVGEILACCDFALAREPRPRLEKSGAFIAFAAAGLAVLVWQPDSLGPAETPELPVIAADSWDWQQAKSERVSKLRRAIQEHANAHYCWDTIAQRAVELLRSIS